MSIIRNDTHKKKNNAKNCAPIFQVQQYDIYTGIALMVFEKSPKGDKKRSIIILFVVLKR